MHESQRLGRREGERTERWEEGTREKGKEGIGREEGTEKEMKGYQLSETSVGIYYS